MRVGMWLASEYVRVGAMSVHGSKMLRALVMTVRVKGRLRNKGWIYV